MLSQFASRVTINSHMTLVPDTKLDRDGNPLEGEALATE
jgi:hypothetical protein